MDFCCPYLFFFNVTLPSDLKVSYILALNGAILLVLTFDLFIMSQYKIGFYEFSDHSILILFRASQLLILYRTGVVFHYVTT